MFRAFVLALALGVSALELAAQQPAAPPAPAAPAEPAAPQVPDQLPPLDDFGRNGEEVVRVGSDYTLAAGDEVDEIVVVMGTATIDGRIDGDLVVVLGEARLGPMAVVEGDVVVVGGSLAVQSGAVARNDLVVVGGGLDAPPDFMAQGEQVVFGFRALGDRVRGLLPWLMRGLLWGRPIVPDLGWVWALVFLVSLIYLLLLLVFDHPVRVTADTLADTPLKALVTGLIVLLLLGPIVLLLAASVIGLLVVPVALCAVFVAGLVGKIAVARWLGSRLVSEGDEHSRLLLARSFAIGSVLLIVIYMVPILGGVVWGLAGATGLGAATLAFMSAYRKENPPPPAPVAPLVPPPYVPPPASGAMPGPAAAFVAEDPVAGIPPVPTQQASLFPRASFTDRLAAFVLDAPSRGDHDWLAGPARRRHVRACVPVLSFRVLGLEGRHGRRHHLPAPPHAHGRITGRTSRGAGPEPRQHLLDRRVGDRLPVGPARPRAAGLARQDGGHLRGEGASPLAVVGPLSHQFTIHNSQFRNATAVVQFVTCAL